MLSLLQKILIYRKCFNHLKIYVINIYNNMSDNQELVSNSKSRRGGQPVRNKTMKYECVWYHPLTGEILCVKQFGRMKDLLDTAKLKGINQTSFWHVLKEDEETQRTGRGFVLRRVPKQTKKKRNNKKNKN
jgi:hypothetical protein